MSDDASLKPQHQKTTGFRVIKFSSAIQVLLILLLSSVMTYAQTNEKARTLKACSELFGSPIDSKKSLFEVNSLFVLQAKYDSHDHLSGLAVFPKYWLEDTHPEWKEPEKMPLLSTSEYENLLGRLDSVKPKGQLIQAGKGSVVTNSTDYFLDQYMYAFVRRGDYGEQGVRFATLYYFHEVEGKIKRKWKYSSLFQENYFQVLVGELKYFVRREDYPRLRVGQVRRFLGVGPI